MIAQCRCLKNEECAVMGLLRHSLDCPYSCRNSEVIENSNLQHPHQFLMYNLPFSSIIYLPSSLAVSRAAHIQNAIISPAQPPFISRPILCSDEVQQNCGQLCKLTDTSQCAQKKLNEDCRERLKFGTCFLLSAQIMYFLQTVSQICLLP